MVELRAKTDHQESQVNYLQHFTDENALWTAIREGQTGAFKVLYEAYADVLYRYGLRYFPEEETVKDCMHDLFVDLHRYHRNLSPSVNIRFYLLGAFRRKLHEARKKTTSRHLDAYADPSFLIDYAVEHHIMADEQQKETLRRLSAALQLLPARQKEVLYLRYNCELSYEEVAQVMKISVPTCRTLAYRAFQQLREQLKNAPVYYLVICLFYCLF